MKQLLPSRVVRRPRGALIIRRKSLVPKIPSPEPFLAHLTSEYPFELTDDRRTMSPADLTPNAGSFSSHARPPLEYVVDFKRVLSFPLQARGCWQKTRILSKGSVGKMCNFFLLKDSSLTEDCELLSCEGGLASMHLFFIISVRYRMVFRVFDIGYGALSFVSFLVAPPPPSIPFRFLYRFVSVFL